MFYQERPALRREQRREMCRREKSLRGGFNRDEFVTVREFDAFLEFALLHHFGCF